MLKDISDISDQPTVLGDISAAATRSSRSWLDESWQVTMGNQAQAQPKQEATSDDPRDLCGICVYGSECMHLGTAERPKLYCELFDVDVKAFGPREDNDSQNGCNLDKPVDLTGGLCCNCEHRGDCTIRMAKGNVWHCEEYA